MLNVLQPNGGELNLQNIYSFRSWLNLLINPHHNTCISTLRVLIKSLAVFSLFYLFFKQEYLQGAICICKTDVYVLIQITLYVSNFDPLEVVVRNSETQSQVGTNWNSIV